MVQPFYKLAVNELIRETKDAISIKLEVPAEQEGEFNFKAGQYLTIVKEIAGKTIRRSYSISSIPTDNELKITCKRIEGGIMSNYLYQELAIGEKLDVKPPQGSFRLRNLDKDLVLFAGGSGITPIISLLREFLLKSDKQAHLYYGNTSREDIIFLNELEALKKEYSGRFLLQHYLSGDGERIDKERVKSLVDKTISANSDYYVCGPNGMMKSVLAGLEESISNEAGVYTEYFNNPLSDKSAETITKVNMSSDVNKVIVRLDDQDHQIALEEGESILEGAERIGIDPPFSCHSGVCTTCKAKLISGKVRMENNFGLGQDEEDEGFVLTCIGYPEEAGTKIDWDQG